MERQCLVREKRRDGNVMLRGQVLAELPDNKVRVKIEDPRRVPSISTVSSPRTNIKEVSKEDVLPGSKYFGQPVDGKRPSIIGRQYTANVNSISNMYLER